MTPLVMPSMESASKGGRKTRKMYACSSGSMAVARQKPSSGMASTSCTTSPGRSWPSCCG